MIKKKEVFLVLFFGGEFRVRVRVRGLGVLVLTGSWRRH